jgi:hypothetical protein
LEPLLRAAKIWTITDIALHAQRPFFFNKPKSITMPQIYKNVIAYKNQLLSESKFRYKNEPIVQDPVLSIFESSFTPQHKNQDILDNKPTPNKPLVPTPNNSPTNRVHQSPTGQERLLRSMDGQYVGEEKVGSHFINRIKYYTDLKIRREKYQVEIGKTLRRRQQLFDTKEINKRVEADKKSPGCDLGASKKGGEFQRPQDWTEGGLIWVCVPDPETNRPVIYSHVGKMNTRHSSLAGGTEVIGAGEWIVRRGKLLKISANSGHYQTTTQCLYHAVLHMSIAFNHDTTVFLYDSKDDRWIDYPIRNFISKPTNGGRLRTHPKAQA